MILKTELPYVTMQEVLEKIIQEHLELPKFHQIEQDYQNLEWE